MKFLIGFALALVWLPASTFAIYEGDEAKIGQFPYLVRLALVDSDGARTSCGGAIIGEKWILTAAHCLCPYVDVENATIYMGTNERNPDDIEPVTVSKNNFNCHRDYKRFSRRNDIALIEVPSIKFSTHVKAVNLPAFDIEYIPGMYEGKEVVASGWGRLSSKAEYSTDDLQYLNMTVSDTVKCIKAHNSIMVNATSNICAVAPDNGSTCFGDSGGPIEENGTVIGIVSVGTSNTCEDGKPNVFTCVHYYVQWIFDNTQIRNSHRLRLPNRNRNRRFRSGRLNLPKSVI